MFILKNQPSAFEFFFPMKYVLLLAHCGLALGARPHDKKMLLLKPEEEFFSPSKQGNAKRSTFAHVKPTENTIIA